MCLSFFFLVDVRVSVREAAVGVRMPVDLATSDHFVERVGPETDQHHGYAELEELGHPFADLKLENYDEQPKQQQCRRVADAPEGTDDRRAPDAFSITDDVRHRREMIWFKGVPEPHAKAEQQKHGDRRYAYVEGKYH